VALTTQFDPLFVKHRGTIPVAYLRALAQRESGLNPNANAGKAAAQGLLQIVTVVRDSYNQRHGTSYTRDDTLDPELNVKMATDLLKRIIVAYNKHPDPNLHENWSNPEFVKLITAGWNAGYSEGGGLGKVARYLEQRGQPVTHDRVYGNAAAAGAVGYLSDPNRAGWHRSVAQLYFAQPDRPRGPSIAGLALAAFAAWGVYRLMT
jgi:soluble lytic murein transglycosylase-like protein